MGILLFYIKPNYVKKVVYITYFDKNVIIF